MAKIPGVVHPDEVREQVNMSAAWLERYKDFGLDDRAKLEASLLDAGVRGGGSIMSASRLAEQLHHDYRKLAELTESIYGVSQQLHSVLSDATREAGRRSR